MNKYQRISEIRRILTDMGLNEKDYKIEFPTNISVILSESGEKKLTDAKKDKLKLEKITLKTS